MVMLTGFLAFVWFVLRSFMIAVLNGFVCGLAVTLLCLLIDCDKGLACDFGNLVWFVVWAFTFVGELTLGRD